mgnify:CR=1 FL=1
MIQLGDICTKASSNIAQKDLQNCDGVYPIYGASGLIKHVNFYQQENPYVAVVKDGAGVGRVMQLPAKSSVIGTMQYILPNIGVSVHYLAYAMEHMNLAKYYTGATIPHIYFKDYCKENLHAHNIDEQYHIAHMLDKIVDLISHRKQQLAKLDELVKARFVEMFGDPVRNPYGWEIRHFEEISTLITDGEHVTPRRVESGIYLLSARNVLNHAIQVDDVDYIDQTEYARIAKRVVPQAGDILISCSGSIGRCCVVPDNFKFQMVRSIALIRFRKQINPVFAEWLITSDDLQRQILQAATQSSQANLFQGRIKKLRGYVPPLKLQDRFADFVVKINRQKLTIQQSLDQLEVLRKSLMQEYFG